MLEIIRKFTVKLLSSIATITMFVVMLPLTFAAMMIMLFAGVATLATIRHRLRESGVNMNWQKYHGTQPSDPQAVLLKPPIEGSYKVVEK